jgi:hypothetical protein
MQALLGGKEPQPAAMRRARGRRWRWRWRVGWVLAFGAAVRPASAGQILLDPWAGAAVVRAACAQPAQLKAGGRVHLVLFANGETACSLPGAPFPVRDPAASESLYAQVATACAQAKVPLYVACDLLRWERADVGRSKVVADHPDWLEDFPRDWCQPPTSPDRYVSPHHPQVQAAIKALLAAVAKLQPRPAGVTLAYRLSDEVPLGFSVASRAATIRGHGLDPIDIYSHEDWLAYSRWVEDAFAAQFKALTAGLRQAMPGVKVTAWVNGAYHTRPPGDRERTGDNWIRWLTDGAAEDALLDDQWQVFRRADEFLLLERMAKTTPALAPLLAKYSILVRMRDAEGKPLHETQLRFLKARHAPTGRVTFQPGRPEDLAIAAAYKG